MFRAVCDQHAIVLFGAKRIANVICLWRRRLGRCRRPRTSRRQELDEALREAQEAVALAPDAIQTQLELGDVLREMGQPQQARTCYEEALQLAKTIEPDFLIRSVPSIEQGLQSL